MRYAGYGALAVGFASMLAQLSLLREFLNVFQGNELVFGLVLGCWLLLVGLGSYAAGRLKLKDYRTAFALTLIVSAAALPATIYMSKTAGYYLTVRGEMAGLPQILLAAVATLSLYCLLYGLQINLVCSILAEELKVGGVGWGYTLDSLGNVLGGVAFSFILVNTLNSFQISYVAAAVNLAAACLMSKRLRVPAVMLIVVLAVSAFTVDLQDATNRMQYEGQKVLAQRDTMYGNLVVTESMSQINFFENSMPLFSTGDTAAAEETVHYAMLQLERPGKVLLISGGVSGTLKEILKYGVERVDYVELDPAIIELAREYAPGSGLDDARVNVIAGDGRLYVKTTQVKYDAVIVGLPDPTTAQLNRFYTVEFFREAKGVMAEGGVFSTGMSSSENYMNEEVRGLNAGLYSTLKEVFTDVIALPGGRNIYVASDSKLSSDIISLARMRGLNASYVNEYYLKGVHTPDRLKYLAEAVSAGGEINRDFKPTAYYRYLRYWLSYFNLDFDLAWTAAALILLSAAVYMKLKPMQAGVLAVGFTGTALEMVILISFQALYGYVYHQAGLIVTSFMAGLVAAAYIANTRLGGAGVREFRVIVLGVALYSLLLPVAVAALGSLGNATLVQASVQLLYPVLTAALGALVGMLFTMAAGIMSKTAAASETAGTLYGLDLLGAFMGSILVSVFLIPAMGLINVCVLTALINLAGWWRLGRK